jgi:hypothetical protein
MENFFASESPFFARCVETFNFCPFILVSIQPLNTSESMKKKIEKKLKKTKQQMLLFL